MALFKEIYCKECGAKAGVFFNQYELYLLLFFASLFNCQAKESYRGCNVSHRMFYRQRQLFGISEQLNFQSALHPQIYV